MHLTVRDIPHNVGRVVFTTVVDRHAADDRHGDGRQLSRSHLLGHAAGRARRGLPMDRAGQHVRAVSRNLPPTRHPRRTGAGHARRGPRATRRFPHDPARIQRAPAVDGDAGVVVAGGPRRLAHLRQSRSDIAQIPVQISMSGRPLVAPRTASPRRLLYSASIISISMASAAVARIARNSSVV